MEVVGIALASADALLKTFSSLHSLLQRRKARKELPALVSECKKHVGRMRVSVNSYSEGVPENEITRNVLRSASVEFDKINSELQAVLNSRSITFKSREHAEKVRECIEKLRLLENHLDLCRLVTHDNMSVREQLTELVNTARNNAEPPDDSKISSAPEKNDIILSTSNQNDVAVDTIPERTRKILNGLSCSGIPEDLRQELVEMARNAWNGWKVNPSDIKFVKISKDGRNRIGGGATGPIYLARMKLRNEKGAIIPGEVKEVAVKQLKVKPAEEKKKLMHFIRDIFLQMDVKHDCIVQTFGGYWPDARKSNEGDNIEPYIVMERMTHNLRQVLGMQLLTTQEAKRRIILDIFAGIGHLHSQGIVHRDIKPENVLLRVVDGEIVGRAKLCGLCIPRTDHQTDMETNTIRNSSQLAETLAYMPPEVTKGSAPQTEMVFCDIWSLGVLMCEVLDPDFLPNLVGEYSDGLESLVRGIGFTKKVVQSAHHISCNRMIEDIVISCLFPDPALRPRIENLIHQMDKDSSESRFLFNDFYSWDFRAAQVLRYVRKHFASEDETKNISKAIRVLEEAVLESSNLSAQSVLGYCHYFGIGVNKNEEKAISLFKSGFDAGDDLATYAMGVVHSRMERFDSAVALFTKAVKLGSIGAISWLAMCYRQGYGVEEDGKRAFQLISSAAEAGNEEAEAMRACYIREGIGTAKDDRLAFVMMREACANGSAFAALKLASWYKLGIAVPEDEENAKQLSALSRKRGICESWASNLESNFWKISGK